MEDPLLIVVAVATSIGAIAGVVAVYYTRHSHERSERWRRLDRLESEFDAWSNDIQVQDPYWINHSASDRLGDGRASVRETVPNRFTRRFDKFLDDSADYEKMCDRFFESIQDFCESETGLRLESNREEEIPEGFSLQPLFVRTLVRVLIYRTMEREINEIEYKIERFLHHGNKRIRNGVRVEFDWWPETGISLSGEIARHVVDGAEPVIDSTIDETLHSLKLKHQAYVTGNELDQFQTDATEIVKEWGRLNTEAAELRSELVNLRAG